MFASAICGVSRSGGTCTSGILPDLGNLVHLPVRLSVLVGLLALVGRSLLVGLSTLLALLLLGCRSERACPFGLVDRVDIVPIICSLPFVVSVILLRMPICGEVRVCFPDDRRQAVPS